MNAPDLCDELNNKGYITDSGNPFNRQGRGIYKLLSGTYKTLKDQGKNDEAEAVAEAFTKPDGVNNNKCSGIYTRFHSE